MNADAATIRAGLKVASSLLITLLAVNLLGVVGNSLAYGGFSFGVLLRFALLVWLCWSVYSGKIWARVFLALLLLAYGVTALIAAFGVGGGFGLFMGLIGLLQVGAHSVCS